MSYLFISIIVVVVLSGTLGSYTYKTELKSISKNEFLGDRRSSNGSLFDTKFAEGKSGVIPRDTGGNYGDLIYKFRSNSDTLLLREVVIADELYSNEQDLRWTVSINGARITSVRVLNFGRERAFCLRIDVAAGDAEVVLRIPSLVDPRVMIEIYGF
ncbi:unnamed protein product [Phyllotreta striolata]|uniref:Uncharacterized protein n=1 Tax=Phyllotreta striolata TaxID=444603 RepID=A0A9N9XK80_PHYSR|nr:unnamed protein product [Phyllotreta striolata]